MNNLSWFLYFADVLPKMAEVIIVTGIFTLTGGLLLGAILSKDTYESKEKAQKAARASVGWFKLAAFSVCLMFCSVLIPSKNTIYAIAASEIGESAVKSEVGKRGLRAIEAWINNQLEVPVKK